MERREGIKEVTELINGVEGFTIDLVKALKDGFQFTDLFKMFGAMKDLGVGIQGANKIVAELKDLDDMELAQLLEETKEFGVNIFKALRG